MSGLTLAGSGAGNYSLTQPTLSANITAKGVTVASGITADSKVYDGTDVATISSNAVTLAGVVSGEEANVTVVTNGYEAHFNDATVEDVDKSVTVSGLTLAGSGAGNYSLTQPVLPGVHRAQGCDGRFRLYGEQQGL